MKRLLTLLVLSLVTVACNKENDNIVLYDWDKIVSEMNLTELSVNEVLESLQQNEYWSEVVRYHYFFKDGKIEEKTLKDEEQELLDGGGSYSVLRFAENSMYSYEYTIGTSPYCVEYKINNTDNGFIASIQDVKVSEWKIVAYDENQVLVEIYPIFKQEPSGNGEFLYSKVLIVRKSDNTKWWEDAK